MLNKDPLQLVNTYFSEEQEEIIDFKKIDLKKEYKKWNDKLFNGELPDIPMKFFTSKKVGGRVTYKAISGPRNTYSDISDMKMDISNSLELTLNEFYGILIHEMIHVYFAIKKLNVGHTHEFIKKAKELSTKSGINVPLTNDTVGKKVSQTMKGKDVQFIVVINQGKHWIGMTNNTNKFDINNHVHLFSLRVGDVFITGEAITSLAYKYPISRLTNEKSWIKIYEADIDDYMDITKNAKTAKMWEIAEDEHRKKYYKFVKNL